MLPEFRKCNPTVRLTPTHPASSLCSKSGNKRANRAGHKLFLTDLHTILIISLLKGVPTTFFQVIDLIYILSMHFWKTPVISNRTN